jgi:hypothetical protein
MPLARGLAASVLILFALAAPVAAAEPEGRFTDDFSTPIGDRWEIHGGTWRVVDGELQGLGIEDTMTAADPAGGGVDLAGAVAVVRGVRVANAEICLDMTALERVDKGVVLRCRNPKNGIWLGFRANRDEEWFADMTVAEAVRGKPTLYTPEFSVPIPRHEMGDTIRVCARLSGRNLRVVVDGAEVLHRSFPFRVATGAVGVHALADNLVAYDNVKVTELPATEAESPSSVEDQEGSGWRVLAVSAVGWLLAGAWRVARRNPERWHPAG